MRITKSKMMNEWHNIAEGRIFILGTGPSLGEQLPLLHKLAGEATFGCNSLPKWDLLPFTPTYYGVTDIRYQSDMDRLVFPSMKMHRFNVQWDGDEPHNDAFIRVAKDRAENVASVGFTGTGDVLPPIPSGRTSPITLAQLAAWMGYREFYFLGIEQTRGYVHDPNATMSMTDRQKFPLDKSPRYQLAIQRCAERMRQDMEAAGGAVYDCTPGGLLNETGSSRRSVPHRTILPYRALEEVWQ